MKFEPTSLPEVIRVTPAVHEDGRGFFMETWQAQRYRDAGIDADFVQDNVSRSSKGTLRGLHYQVKQAQGKLVRVVQGEVFDVAVELRKSSPQYGQWVGEVLTAENRHQLWIPPGFGHGFLHSLVARLNRGQLGGAQGVGVGVGDRAGRLGLRLAAARSLCGQRPDLCRY